MSDTSMASHPLNDFARGERARILGFIRSRLGRLSDDDEAEDLAQDVFLRVLEQLDPASPIEDLASYVWRSVRNRISDWFRRRKPDVPIDAALADEDSSLLDILADTYGDPAALMERASLEAEILAAIEALSPTQREIIIATELEGRSVADLSREWDVPRGTLLARRHRGLEQLRHELASLSES